MRWRELCWGAALGLWLTAVAGAEEKRTATIRVESLRPEQEPLSPATPLDPITTTATRTARQSFTLPESVSQLGAEDIDHFGADRLSAALGHLPSVDISGGPRPGADFISIRGLGGTRVALNVDGARQNFDGAHRSNLLLDPDLLKSVDVLRGPASAIWGSDALGGVISITTRDAADFLQDGETMGGRIKLGLDSASGERRRGLTAFGRVGSLDLLADTIWRDTEDLQQSAGRVLPFSASRTHGGLYKLTQFFSVANELSLTQQAYRQSARTPSNPSKDAADDNPLLDRVNRQHTTTARYTYQATGAEPLFAGANLTLYRSALDVIEDRVDEPRHDTLDFGTTGASLQSTLNIPAWDSRLTLGAEGWRDHSKASRDGVARPQYPDARRKVRGFFVQSEVQWQDLSLIPGLRLDRYRSQTRQSNATPDLVSSQLSPKLGASYELHESLTLTASYARAFRAPSLLESYAQGTHFLGNEFRPNPDLKPERAQNRELGLRLRLRDFTGADDRLQLRLGMFDNRVRDYIETVVVLEQQGPFPPALQCAPPNPEMGCVNRNDDGSANLAVPVLVWVGGHTTSENVPRARIRGGEAELDFRWGGYHFRADYSRLRGENLNSGMPLLSIAPDTLHLDLGYAFGDRLQDLELGLRATQASTQRRVPLLVDGTPAIPTTPGYAVLDVYGGWKPQRWLSGLKLNFGIDNLADRNYRRHLSQDAEAGRSLRAAMTYQF